MNIRYISDLHINDPSMLGWRPQFSSHARMIDYMIGNWNSTTEEDDLVIVNGDVGEYTKRTKEVLNELNGKKILVLGNHDHAWRCNVYNNNCFMGVYEFLTLEGVLVAHIPNECLDSPKYYYVHGHHHRYDVPGMLSAYKDYVNHPLRLNCSADLVDFRPKTLRELITNKELWIEKMEEVLNNGTGKQ